MARRFAAPRRLLEASAKREGEGEAPGMAEEMRRREGDDGAQQTETETETPKEGLGRFGPHLFP